MGRIRKRRNNGLAWPARDVGPTPPPEYRSREREEERLTRKPMVLWDRIKLLLLLAAAAFFMLSASITSNPPLQLQFLETRRSVSPMPSCWIWEATCCWPCLPGSR